MDEGRRGGAEWVNEGRVVDEGRGVAFFFSFMEGGGGWWWLGACCRGNKTLKSVEYPNLPVYIAPSPSPCAASRLLARSTCIGPLGRLMSVL